MGQKQAEKHAREKLESLNRYLAGHLDTIRLILEGEVRNMGLADAKKLYLLVSGYASQAVQELNTLEARDRTSRLGAHQGCPPRWEEEVEYDFNPS